MKMHSIIGLVLFTILIGPVATMAQTTVIDDSQNGANTYYGGYVTQPSIFYDVDVIYNSNAAQSEALYGVDAMTVTFSGSMMTVKLTGPFFAGTEASRADYSGLFISDSGWQVADTSGGPNFPNDVFGIKAASGTPTPGEGWDYVVGSRFDQATTSYIPGVYNLDWAGIMWTTGGGAGFAGTGRAYQAYGGGMGTLPAVSGANITLDASGMTYTILDDSFLAGKTLGLHWTMDCGNDVVEGQVTVPPNVPEPSAIILLGFGLAGLGVYRRRVGSSGAGLEA